MKLFVLEVDMVVGRGVRCVLFVWKPFFFQDRIALSHLASTVDKIKRDIV